jgi:hypothetical protein
LIKGPIFLTLIVAEANAGHIMVAILWTAVTSQCCFDVLTWTFNQIIHLPILLIAMNTQERGSCSISWDNYFTSGSG